MIKNIRNIIWQHQKISHVKISSSRENPRDSPSFKDKNYKILEIMNTHYLQNESTMSSSDSKESCTTKYVCNIIIMNQLSYPSIDRSTQDKRVR